MPQEQLNHYGSDFIEGFNNLNLELSHVKEVLSRNYFKGKYLTAVGKLNGLILNGMIIL